MTTRNLSSLALAALFLSAAGMPASARKTIIHPVYAAKATYLDGNQKKTMTLSDALKLAGKSAKEQDALFQKFILTTKIILANPGQSAAIDYSKETAGSLLEISKQLRSSANSNDLDKEKHLALAYKLEQLARLIIFTAIP